MSGTAQDVRLRMQVNIPDVPQVFSSTCILSLQADSLDLNDGDPVSIWLDQSGFRRNFSQSDVSLQPIYHAGVSGSYVQFPIGQGKALVGPDFADNLSSFTVFAVYRLLPTSSDFPPLISKSDVNLGTGWEADIGYFFYIVHEWSDEAEVDAIGSIYYPPDGGLHLVTHELITKSNLHMLVDGNDVSNDGSFGNPVTDYSNEYPVMIGLPVIFPNTVEFHLNSIMIYYPAPNANDRTAIDVWLAARYGITLP